jgi:hypothetical protein
MGGGTLGDHQTLVRDGFRMILDAQEDIEVVGEAADGLEAIAKAHELGAVALPPKRDSYGLRVSFDSRRAQYSSRSAMRRSAIPGGSASSPTCAAHASITASANVPLFGSIRSTGRAVPTARKCSTTGCTVGYAASALATKSCADCQGKVTVRDVVRTRTLRIDRSSPTRPA